MNAASRKLICLIKSLIKACSRDDYPYYDELVEGVAVTKRVTNRINEAQRIAENRQIVKALEARIEDWKGHHIVNFGHLLLQDFFNVTKSDVDREYHVFLFQKIILCCKEDPRSTLPVNGKKVTKSNSILKKQVHTSSTSLSNFASSARKSTTPLLLKGRIFLNNVIEAVAVGKGGEHTRPWQLS
jgi:cell division control protein 24